MFGPFSRCIFGVGSRCICGLVAELAAALLRSLGAGLRVATARLAPALLALVQLVAGRAPAGPGDPPVALQVPQRPAKRLARHAVAASGHLAPGDPHEVVVLASRRHQLLEGQPRAVAEAGRPELPAQLPA